MSTNHGGNERGRDIVYQVFRNGPHGAQKPILSFAAGRFSEDRVRAECRARGVSGTVVVSWWTSSVWGMDRKTREVAV